MESEPISYPTRKGLPIDPREIYEPTSSELNLEVSKNWNNHHWLWRARDYHQQLYFCLRSLAGHQCYLPVDIHNDLHQEYEPPEKPSPLVAITRLEQALDNKEEIRIKASKKIGGITLRAFTQEDFEKCKASYNSLKRK